MIMSQMNLKCFRKTLPNQKLKFQILVKNQIDIISRIYKLKAYFLNLVTNSKRIMQSLTTRWKTKIQNQSAQELKLSVYSQHKKEFSPEKIKQSATVPLEDHSKQYRNRDERQRSSKDDKNKNSRMKSSENRKNQSGNQKSSVFIAQTPCKNIGKRQQRLIQNCASNIIELVDGRGSHNKQKVKALLQDLIMKNQTQENMNSSIKVGIGDRAYSELEVKYLQSEKQRQYLKGKMQMSSKRYESLERQLQRYAKMEKMIDNSINRQNQLRQEITRLKAERTQLQSQMQLQNQFFNKEKNSILELVEELKLNLPIN